MNINAVVPMRYSGRFTIMKLYQWQLKNRIPIDRKGRPSTRTGKHACNRGWIQGKPQVKEKPEPE